jgi:putative FmdB family regulatory protein
MPMYEFKCTKCSDVFEELIRNTKDNNDVQCPECGSPDVKRVLSSFADSTSSSGGALPACGAPRGSCGGGGGFS